MVCAGWIVMPGVFIGTMNMLMPACGGVAFRVGSRGEEHVFSPPGRGPDLLAVDDPAIAVAHCAGAQRREIGTGLGFAVTHAVHGFAAQDFGQVFLLLLRRAEHHQRVGLDRRTDPRRLAALHRLDEGDLFQRRACLAAELLRAIRGRSIRSCRYPVRIPDRTRAWRTAWRRRRPCGRPTSFARASCAPARATRCRPDRDRIAAAARHRRDRADTQAMLDAAHAGAPPSAIVSRCTRLKCAAPRALRHSRWRRRRAGSPAKRAATPRRRRQSRSRRNSASCGRLDRAGAAAWSSVSRTPSSAMRQLASLCWIAWNFPIGCPN